MTASELVYETMEDYRNMENGSYRLSLYSFGNNQAEVPLEILADASACMPTMIFYRTFENGVYFFDTEDNLYSFSKNVIYGKDIYGNECIIAYVMPKGKRYEYEKITRTLPDMSWFVPEIREVSLPKHDSFAAYISPKAFLHLAFQNIEYIFSCYMHKFSERYGIISKLNPLVNVDFSKEAVFEMLKRVTKNGSGILFAVSERSDDKQMYVDIYEVSGSQFLLISAAEKGNQYTNFSM